MKTIEEKAKAYDEAIEKFGTILNLDIVKESGTIFADDVRKILPELAESEDERMSKYLIKYFEANKDELSKGFKWNGITVEECIAWLEKQGEKEAKGNEREIPNSEQKTDNKIEPKFREGDIITHKKLSENNSHKIIQVDMLDKKYRLEGGLVAHFSEQENYERVVQKPNWKPSDEQMKQLGWIAKQNKDNMIGKELMTLYNDLKKIREE